jgi:hypothetical protein
MHPRQRGQVAQRPLDGGHGEPVDCLHVMRRYTPGLVHYRAGHSMVRPAVRRQDLDWTCLESGQSPQRRGRTMRHDRARSCDEECDLQVLSPTRERADEAVDTVADGLPLLSAQPLSNHLFGRAEIPEMGSREHAVVQRRDASYRTIKSASCHGPRVHQRGRTSSFWRCWPLLRDGGNRQNGGGGGEVRQVYSTEAYSRSLSRRWRDWMSRTVPDFERITSDWVVAPRAS